MKLVRPGPEHLTAYCAALQRGWSADNVRGAVAALEEQERIATDPAAFLALMDDPQGAGPPVTLPDGSQRARIPSLRRWLWEPDSFDGRDRVDGADQTCGGFAGSISLRWMSGGAPLPPHVLGHIGYAIVPWCAGRGLAKQALAQMLPLARAQGLKQVEITTDPDNLASQRVITANGGRLLASFDKGQAYGHRPGLRFVIDLV